MALLLGWQFVAGEFVGGPLMIVLRRRRLPALPARASLVEDAREQAEQGARSGRWRATPRWTCPPTATGSWWQRLRTPQGFTATADYFVMDWAAIWRDIAVGLLIAGALAAWVPQSFWQGALPGRPSDRSRSSGGR